MKESHYVAAAAIALILGAHASGSAQAATCMDELDRFERKLHDSSLADTDPDTFQALVRQAEEAAELRDEEQCLQSVAELNAALPEDSGAAPIRRRSTTSGTTSSDDDARGNESRPAAPVLLTAGDGEPDDSPDDTAEPAENDN